MRPTMLSLKPPAAFCRLPRLSELNLRFNQLTRLPENIGELTGWRVDLRANRLSELPESPGELEPAAQAGSTLNDFHPHA